ncbi:uncharacterized protein SOCE26_040880 [Sorangium cellulosum]|uniref:Secreted protein n=1 Tax=Sorangium cellulosum TaxID=56 RepID=A0A2L0ETP4_SORCE|nr:hypothetical protein [Sorangium cellulosum]AUX42655.1 uncharacterized protein SOCE26_040880 [Sorangium cellulosum]
MNMKNLLLCSLLSSFALVGCIGEPLDGDLEGDDATDTVEAVGEGAEAIIGPGGEEGGGTITRNVNLSCSITYPSIFNVHAEIKNTSVYAVPDYAKITLTVTHYYGSPGPYTSSFNGPLAKGEKKLVPLSHPGALDAYGCTAKATWIVD